MSLLHDIQEAVVQEGGLGPILLKLRLLAAKLGSKPLEDWVMHESEGYPPEIDVPPYRKIPVTYTGLFVGPFGSYMKNHQIPGYLVEKHAGKEWTTHSLREGMAAIDDLLRSTAEHGGLLGIDASNLTLLLQDELYEHYVCTEVQGRISSAALVNVQNTVRGRILELTIEIDKAVPNAASISIGSPSSGELSQSEKVTQLSQQIVYGNVTNISANGTGFRVNVAVGERDSDGLIEYLVGSGIDQEDASALVRILAEESPASVEEPFGDKARTWIAENIKKAADGTWRIGVAVATRVLTEAALRYYGLG